MNKRINIIKNVLITLSLVLYSYITLIGRNQYIYDINYLKSILFMLLLSLVIYTYGIKTNNNKTYKTNIILYIIFYMILLFNVTFILNRGQIQFYTWWYRGQYLPLYTIKSQLKYGTSVSILKNILGNSIMLIPLSFLLMIKNKKYNNILKQTIITLPIIIFIEILQAFTHTGVFDIDDIILNYSGTVIFTFIITRFNIIDKIKKLFYTDYKLNGRVKNIVFYLSIVLLIIFDIYLLI